MFYKKLQLITKDTETAHPFSVKQAENIGKYRAKSTNGQCHQVEESQPNLVENGCLGNKQTKNEPLLNLIAGVPAGYNIENGGKE
jgi:hypothetical protein